MILPFWLEYMPDRAARRLFRGMHARGETRGRLAAERDGSEYAEVAEHAAQTIDTDGALFYEAGPNGITQDHKEWWPQAEAVVGFLEAYELSGNEDWLRVAVRLWEFIETHLVDRTNGEWYRAVTRDRQPIPGAEKAGFWKCPYHNGRACLEVYDRLRSR